MRSQPFWSLRQVSKVAVKLASPAAQTRIPGAVSATA
jgi:hypothetical protein